MAGNQMTAINADLYRLFVEQARDYALFILDVSGRVMTWNAGAQRLKGYFAEEIIGQHFSKFYSKQAVDAGWPAHELIMATREGRFEDEGWRVRKDGTLFWASVVITALRDENGALVGFSKITRDLTERKRYEEALRLSEERLRLLVEGVVDYAIYMLDPEGLVSSWNAGSQRITGYERDEVLGCHFSRFYRQEEIDSGRPWAMLAEARRTGRVEDTGWRVRKDGDRFWGRATVSALRDEAAHLLGFATVIQDLSGHRHVEELEEATRNTQAFIATLSHELRNPLAPIRAAVQVLQERLAGAGAEALSLVQIIDRQSAHLARIVDDMLDVSRIGKGLIQIEPCPLAMKEVVRRSVEAAMPGIAAAGHQLDVELPEDDPYVLGDVHRLTQVLTNLLNNAARYTPHGGRIAIRVESDDDQVVVRVRDNGRGLAPWALERVFDMFVRQSPGATNDAGGIGIGLAISRRIAQLHGGSLSAASDGPGKGAEFVLALSACAAPAPVAAPAATQARAVRRRILIVDDNEDAAHALGLLLDGFGHETALAADGENALRLAADFAPEIVLLDIGLPRMDGYAVAQALRAAGIGGRIVALTGWGQDSHREQTRQAGFDDHLTKPVDVARLLEAIDAPR